MRRSSPGSDHASLIALAALALGPLALSACSKPTPPPPPGGGGALLPPVDAPVLSASALAVAPEPKPEIGFVIDIRDDGKIAFDGVVVEDDGVRAAFAKLPKHATPIFRGAKDAAWGRVIHGLDQMKQAGLSAFVLVIAGDPTRRTPVIELPAAGKGSYAPAVAPRPGEKPSGRDLDSIPRAIQVILTREGKSFLDGAEVTGPLRDRLHSALAVGSDKAVVIVHADMQAPLGAVVDITRDVRAEGAPIAYAVSPTPPEPPVARKLVPAGPGEPADFAGNGIAGGVAGGPWAGPSNVPPEGTRPKPKPKAFDRCAFPAQASKEDIDEASVAIRVKVDATGKPTDVTVVSDPGHGFGEAAKTCAKKASFEPAKDKAGRPTTGEATIRVRFVR